MVFKLLWEDDSELREIIADYFTEKVVVLLCSTQQKAEIRVMKCVLRTNMI